tara:strand:+ start:48 stop:530 length:483 start_codon:yes stop_codon:yes gene_type:complete
MNIYKNFLKKEDFKNLEEAIMGDQFPWFFNSNIVLESKDKTDFQFTYAFLLNGENNCSDNTMDLLQPILSKLTFKQMNRIKANLLTRDPKIKEHGMHTDQDSGTTGIFYVNTCNGYTKFENGKKIKSQQNTYVEFDSTLKHTGSSCTDKQRRVVINFNYQ